MLLQSHIPLPNRAKMLLRPPLPAVAVTEQSCYGDAGACAALPRGEFAPKTSH